MEWNIRVQIQNIMRNTCEISCITQTCDCISEKSQRLDEITRKIKSVLGRGLTQTTLVGPPSGWSTCRFQVGVFLDFLLIVWDTSNATASVSK